MIIIFGLGIVERGMVIGEGNLIFLRLTHPRIPDINPDPLEPPTNNQSGADLLLVVAIDYQKRRVRVGDIVIFRCSSPLLMEVGDEIIPVWHLDEIDTIQSPLGRRTRQNGPEVGQNESSF